MGVPDTEKLISIICLVLTIRSPITLLKGTTCMYITQCLMIRPVCFMSKKTFIQYVMFALAFVGLLDALFLSYTRYVGINMPCPLTGNGCMSVAASPYSVLFGIPLAYIGVLFYTTVLFLLLTHIESRLEFVKRLIVIVAFVGLLASLYFLYVQAFLIGSFCIYCLLSALISFVLALLSVFFIYSK